jgi:hypothetical protein
MRLLLVLRFQLTFLAALVLGHAPPELHQQNSAHVGTAAAPVAAGSGRQGIMG